MSGLTFGFWDIVDQSLRWIGRSSIDFLLSVYAPRAGIIRHATMALAIARLAQTSMIVRKPKTNAWVTAFRTFVVI